MGAADERNMGETLRIFHTADVHLGLNLTRYGDAAGELREARFETLGRMIDLANGRTCNLFVVAGDLFDRVTMKAAEIARAAEILGRFAGDLVIVLPGNHDYMGPESELWTRFRDLASEHTLLLTEARSYDLSSFGLSVTMYAAPCNAKHSSENRIGWITAAERSGDANGASHTRIGIAHGGLLGVSPDLQGRYFPMSIDELTAKGLDLWLLGHTHVRFPDQPGALSRIFNPGTPEPDGLDCHHAGNAFVIEIGAGDSGSAAEPGTAARTAASATVTVRSDIVETGRFRFFDLEVPVEDEVVEPSAEERVARQFGGLAPDRVIARVRWRGRVSATGLAAVRNAEALLRSDARTIEFERTELAEAVTRSAIDARFPESSFPHLLLNALLNEEDAGTAVEIAYNLLNADAENGGRRAH